MPKEIERRFLIEKEKWNQIVTNDMQTDIIQQAYLKTNDGTIDRIRIREGVAIRTVKSNFDGISCDENETEIPLDEGKKLLVKAIYANSGYICKTRTIIPYGTLKIEVDEFSHPDNLKGLIIAEIELPSKEYSVDIPEWFGKEVSGMRSWSNNSLVKYGIPDNV